MDSQPSQTRTAVRSALISATRDEDGDQIRLGRVVEEIAERLDVAATDVEAIVRDLADVDGEADTIDPASLPGPGVAPDHDDRVASVHGVSTPDLARPPGEETDRTFRHLPVRADVDHPLVPELDHEYYERDLPGTDSTDVDVVTKALADGDFWVNLVGHAGVGKNVLIRHIAERTNTPVVRFGASDDISYEDFTGAYAPRPDGDGFEFRYGVGAAAVKYGWWLVVDEINAAPPEIMTALHQVTEEGDNAELLVRETQEVVTPHDNFRLVGTMNPNYAGTQELNKAFASRAYHVRLEYLSAHRERRILEEKTDLDGPALRQLTMFAESVRSRLQSGEIRTPVTTRHLIQIGRMAEVASLHGATKTLLLPYANYNDRDVIDSVIDKFFDDERFRQ